MPRPEPLAHATFHVDRADLDAPPVLADVPDTAAGIRRLRVAALLWGAAVCAWLGALLGTGRWLTDWQTPAALLLLGLGLAVFVPQLRMSGFARRWNAAYPELALTGVAAEGRIAQLDVRRQRTRATVTGRVAYADATGVVREIALGTGVARVFWRLPVSQLPSESSAVVIWHTPDHRIAAVRVHADGSGSATV